MASQFLSRFRSILPLSALLAVLAVSGCVSTSAIDSLDGVTPTGDAFSKALFQDYSYLAHSFDIGGARSNTAYDAANTFALMGSGADVTDLANAYAAKALTASTGEDVLPEDPIEDDPDSAGVHDRLLRALDVGRDKQPDLMARAQAAYDCWAMDAAVDGMAHASAQCHQQALAALSRLRAGPAPAPAPVAQTSPPPPAPPANPDYTVYFDLASWTLTAEDLSVLQQAIDAARQGRQSTIDVVGHTDTSGSADYNMKLSVRRADVVRDALVTMGARADAIKVSGVGESDLAVQTPDGVKEAKNRRTVITLVP